MYYQFEDYKYFKTAYDSTLERKDIPKWFYPKENVYWSGRKIRVTLYQSWNVSNFPFDRHTLTIALEETTRNSSQFVYTPDFVNSRYQRNMDFKAGKLPALKL